MDSSSLSYIGPVVGLVGGIVGIVGGVTGVISAIIAVKSYRLAKATKSLDLRLEAKRARNDAHATLEQLRELREGAIDSRKKVFSAAGRNTSGVMAKYQEQWDLDKERIDELSSQVPGLESAYDDLSPKELEDNLVKLHRTQRDIDALTKRYQDDLQSDENQRNQIRADHRARSPVRRSSFKEN